MKFYLLIKMKDSTRFIRNRGRSTGIYQFSIDSDDAMYFNSNKEAESWVAKYQNEIDSFGNVTIISF